jgi:hypothetical protein
MGKGGAVLGIIGILIGASGLGFGLLSWIQLEQLSVDPGYSSRTWYDYVDYDGIGSSGEGIAGLYISFNLTSGEYIYVSFTCIFQCDGYTAELRILIDDNPTSGYTRETRDSVGGWDWFSMSIQHVNDTLSVGTHTIAVWAKGSDPSNNVQNCVLFVQTLQI